MTGRVEAWLAALDWQAERNALAPYGWDDPRPLPVPSRIIEFRDWAVSLTAYPLKTRGDDPDRRLIGSPPTRGDAVDDITPVLGTLKAKSSRYGKLDLPYVIAVGLMLDFAEFDDLEQALYGPETFVITRTDANRQPQMVISRQPNGLWQRGREHRGTRVSAVLSLQSPSMNSLTAAEPSVWINPWATKPLGYEYPFSTVRAELLKNHLQRTPGALAPYETFGLHEDWPGIQPFAQRHASLLARARRS